MIPLSEQTVSELYESLWYEVNRMLSWKDNGSHFHWFNYERVREIHSRLTQRKEGDSEIQRR